MSFPTSWDDITASSEYGTRPLALGDREGDVYLIVHHAVNLRVQDTIALSKPGGRRVSMTFAIGPTQAGVTAPVYCVGVVPETMRPFTTASPLDQAALTAEVSNIDLTASYPVAEAAKEWLAQIAAYMHSEYRMPLDRVHVLSHQEVYKRGLGSYPTACPGPDLQSSLDLIVERAQQIIDSTKEDEDDMQPQNFYDISTLKGGRAVDGSKYMTVWPSGAITHTPRIIPTPAGVTEPAVQMSRLYGNHQPLSHDLYEQIIADHRALTSGGAGTGDDSRVLDAVSKVPGATVDELKSRL